MSPWASKTPTCTEIDQSILIHLERKQKKSIQFENKNMRKKIIYYSKKVKISIININVN